MSPRSLESFGNLPTVIDGWSLGRKPVHPSLVHPQARTSEGSRGLQEPLSSSKGVTDVTLGKGGEMNGKGRGNTSLDREDAPVNGILPSKCCSPDH